MKKLTLVLLVVLVAFSQSNGQCTNYYDLKEGTLIEMLSFTAKNKQEGRTVTKVSSYTPKGDGFVAIFNSSIYDKKNNESHSGDMEIKCSNGIMLMDMRNFIPEESLKSMQGAEWEIKGDFLEIPSQLSVGQTLKDGTIEMSVIADQAKMSMTVNIVDRKVVGKESVTTPAGNFDCFKISYTVRLKNSIMGININNVMKMEEWVSEGYGVVKSSTYNSKGNLTGYTLLGKFER